MAYKNLLGPSKGGNPPVPSTTPNMVGSPQWPLPPASGGKGSLLPPNSRPK